MKIQANIHLNEVDRTVLIYPHLSETPEHRILKLAAALIFFAEDPIVAPSPQHPALLGGEFVPDLMSVDDSPQVRLWVECETTTPHKLGKVVRRFRDARIEMFTSQPREALQMAETLDREGLTNIGLLSFAEGEFRRWKSVVGERNEIIGEANEESLNLVINDAMFVSDLVRIRKPTRS